MYDHDVNHSQATLLMTLGFGWYITEYTCYKFRDIAGKFSWAINGSGPGAKPRWGVPGGRSPGGPKTILALLEASISFPLGMFLGIFL